MQVLNQSLLRVWKGLQRQEGPVDPREEGPPERERSHLLRQVQVELRGSIVG